MAGDDRLRELEEKYEGYKVYDNNGESIGKVDDLFVDESDREEYIGVKMGLFGLSGTTLIPVELVRVNEQDRIIEVAESKDRVKDAPQYSDDDEIDRSFEARIREHFGLGGGAGGSYDRPVDAAGTEGAAAGDNTTRGGDLGASDEGYRETVGREEYRNRETYDSDSAMAGTAGGATSGGMSDLDTGDREGRGDYREGERQEYREGGGQEYREGERRGEGASEDDAGSGAGGEGSGEDPRVREAYMEGYREAIRDVHSQGGGPSGSTGSSGEQGGESGERQAAGEYFGAPPAGSGEKEGDEEGRTRVRRLRRGS